jgi:mono/diheme cytochrome c family protein
LRLRGPTQRRAGLRAGLAATRQAQGPFLFRAVAILIGTLALAACRQDMHDAPRYDPLEKSAFFTDGQASRPFVPNTIPRGLLREDRHLYEGVVDGKPAEAFPMAVTPAVMARGRERFDVFCSPCHGRTGEGNGMVVQRGFRKPPSYHEDRLRSAPAGYFFDVMTRGFGAMPDYASQITPVDRWAVAAYIRALQLSQRANVADVPADRRADLDRPAGAAAPAPAAEAH